MITTEAALPRRTPTTDAELPSPHGLPRWAPLAGSVAAMGAVLVIWAVRFRLDHVGYVSQLGADAVPGAGVFNAALLTLGAGACLAAAGLRGQRATVAVLSWWGVSATLLAAGVAFAAASRVTCTLGCPVPLTPGSSLQDLGHVGLAVVGFATATWTMLQLACSTAPRAVRLVSWSAAGSVGAAAAAGALLSLLGVGTHVGAQLEFVAMTVAVSWLVAVSSWAAVREPTGPARADLGAPAARW